MPIGKFVTSDKNFIKEVIYMIHYTPGIINPIPISVLKEHNFIGFSIVGGSYMIEFGIRITFIEPINPRA